MILFPAIDLKDGACVRLKLGDMQQATVFNTDPGAQARQFQTLGFTHLHVVDLNGSFAGKPVNAAAVDAILKAFPPGPGPMEAPNPLDVEDLRAIVPDTDAAACERALSTLAEGCGSPSVSS